MAERAQFIGLKDATGDLARMQRLAALIGPQFGLLSGDDATAPAFLALGGHGCISVTSNVVPSLCRMLFLACRQGEHARAQRLARPIAELTAALFRESSPAPLKHALSLLGLMSPTLRLPLVEPSEAVRSEIAAVIVRVSAEYGEYVIRDRDGIGSPHPGVVAV